MMLLKEFAIRMSDIVLMVDWIVMHDTEGVWGDKESTCADDAEKCCHDADRYRDGADRDCGDERYCGGDNRGRSEDD
jgi:hypothetical protein